MSGRVDFHINDVVQIGYCGRKGKIVNIVRSLGKNNMYKVQMYDDGTIVTAAIHELVKGLPLQESPVYDANLTHQLLDESFELEHNDFVNDEMYVATPIDVFNTESAGSPEIENLDPPVHLCPHESTTASNQYLLTTDQPSTLPEHTDKSLRFPVVEQSTHDFVKHNQNKNTTLKTVGHEKLLLNFLKTKNESRQIHEIPPEELDNYLANFFMRIKQKDGNDYEPVTLRSMLGSFERILNTKQYGHSVVHGHQFTHTRQCLKTKYKLLKKAGKGNKPKTADEIAFKEIDYLWEKGQLGCSNPEALLNTLWLYNTIHFGIRGGGSEHRQICWGDIGLNYDTNLNLEYLEFNERCTKTRTGENLQNTRLVKPKMYATGIEGKCPVQIYKMYADNRPNNFSGENDPFYLAPVTNRRSLGPKDAWFARMAVGQNKLNCIMKTKVSKSSLVTEKRLTNTSARKHLCQTLLRNDVPDAQAIQMTGHKNIQSLNNYRQLTNRQQHEMSSILSGLNNNPVPGASNQLIRASATAVSNDYRSTSDMTLNINRSPNTTLKSLFQSSTINGETFNININIGQNNSN